MRKSRTKYWTEKRLDLLREIALTAKSEVELVYKAKRAGINSTYESILTYTRKEKMPRPFITANWGGAR